VNASDAARDSRLLRRLAGGDPNALGEIYDAHALVLYRWLLSTGLSADRAEDILSECLLALVDRGERATTIRNLRAYLFAVARHKLAGSSEREESVALELIAEPADQEVDAAQAVAVREALEELPVEQREVVVLKIWEEHTFAEIGELLEISPNTAASRYRYALEKLRDLLWEMRHG